MGTSEDASVLPEEVFLLLPEIPETPQDALKRLRFGRENPVEVEPVLGPSVIDRGEGEDGLRLEKVVEAALFDTGMLADVIDRGAPIAPRPDQFHHGLEKPFSGVTDSSHATNLPKVDERSTILFQAPLFLPETIRAAAGGFVFDRGNQLARHEPCVSFPLPGSPLHF